MTFIEYCIRCPRGCELTVTVQDGKVEVEGNTCTRGEEYGKTLGKQKQTEQK